MRSLFALVGFGVLAPTIGASATLTGQVQYPDGTGDNYASIELFSEDGSVNASSVQHADKDGWFRFTWLPTGYYRLKITDKGFKTVLMTSIQIAEDEQRLVPPIQLDIAAGSCGTGPFFDRFESMPAADRVGNLGGTVEHIKGGTAIANAKVALLCNRGRVCGETKTDANGNFIFFNVQPGEYAIRVSHAGYYPLEETGYQVREGFEQTYGPFYLEHCPNGNCDPRLRAKRPLITCQ